MLPVYYIGLLFLARISSAYDPLQLIRGFIVIYRPVLATVLISRSDPLHSRNRKNKKENRNKMSFVGLFVYILVAVTSAAHIVLLCLPSLGDANYSIEAKYLTLYADTVNKAIICSSTMLASCVALTAYFSNQIPLAVRRPDAPCRRLIVCVFSFCVLIGLSGVVLFLIDLIRVIGSI